MKVDRANITFFASYRANITFFASFSTIMMMLLFTRAPTTTRYGVTAFATLTTCSPRRFIRNRTSHQFRLYATTKTMKHVEISPSNHGTKPLTSFSSSDLDARLVRALQKQNITVPTPIQAHGIPLIQKGFDVMGSAQTGTGKTLMFGLPLCQQLLKQKFNLPTNASFL